MTMKTVGELLQHAREGKNYSLADIARATRITPRYLSAIEANDFKTLPPATFTKGFLRNYAVTVGLDPQMVLAIFRRDYDQDERGRIIPRGLTQPVKAPLFVITPTRISILISAVLGLIVMAFFIRQIMIFTQAPPLDLTAPADNASLTSPVPIQGSTHPEASVTVNNEPVTVQANGQFTYDLDLTEGPHTLVITASSRGGNRRTIQRQVFVLPPN